MAYPKPEPRSLLKATKRKAERSEWRHTTDRVDARDKRVCQATGVALTGGAVDPWQALERHHLEYRSLNKSRRFNDRNVWTVSRAVHQLIHAGALWVLTKALAKATDVREIAYLAWNRAIVVKGDEPVRLKPKGGIKVVEVGRVHD